MVEAQRREDTDDYDEAADALSAVDKAYDALELETDVQGTVAVPGNTQHVILGVGEAASLSEAAERCDEPLAEATTELSAELSERDLWRLRQLAAAVDVSTMSGRS